MINSLEEIRGCFKEKKKVFKGQRRGLECYNRKDPVSQADALLSDLPGKPSNGNGRKM